MATLYVMCGLAFSGKTTFVEALVRRTGCASVSLDEINAERGLPPGGEGVAPDQWECSSRIAFERLETLMGKGSDVVLDDTCCFRFLRDRYRGLAERMGYRTIVIYMDTPVSEIRRRMAANEQTKLRPGFRPEVFEGHLAAFEAPGADEEVILVAPGDDPW